MHERGYNPSGSPAASLASADHCQDRGTSQRPSYSNRQICQLGMQTAQPMLPVAAPVQAARQRCLHAAHASSHSVKRPHLQRVPLACTSTQKLERDARAPRQLSHSSATQAEPVHTYPRTQHLLQLCEAPSRVSPQLIHVLCNMHCAACARDRVQGHTCLCTPDHS